MTRTGNSGALRVRAPCIIASRPTASPTNIHSWSYSGVTSVFTLGQFISFILCKYTTGRPCDCSLRP